MPLYELVLDFEDRQEVRLTDQTLAVDDTVEIDGTSWNVVRELPPSEQAEARFLCVQVE